MKTFVSTNDGAVPEEGQAETMFRDIFRAFNGLKKSASWASIMTITFRDTGEPSWDHRKHKEFDPGMPNAEIMALCDDYITNYRNKSTEYNITVRSWKDMPVTHLYVEITFLHLDEVNKNSKEICRDKYYKVYIRHGYHRDAYENWVPSSCCSVPFKRPPRYLAPTLYLTSLGHAVVRRSVEFKRIGMQFDPLYFSTSGWLTFDGVLSWLRCWNEQADAQKTQKTPLQVCEAWYGHCRSIYRMLNGGN